MKNDKQKIIVFVALLVVLLAVGAYQLVGNSTSTKNADKQQTENLIADKPQNKPASETTEDAVVADVSLLGLTRKNPFQPSQLPGTQPQKQQPQPSPPPDKRPSTSGAKTLPPFTFAGPPISPPSGVEITPSTPLRSPEDFLYSLVGVVDGPKPVAIFKKDTGEQRIVRLNEALDPDSKVVGITNGRVTVQHRGKKITFTVGGN